MLNLNTSYVTVNLRAEEPQKINHKDLNTSYVTVNPTKNTIF